MEFTIRDVIVRLWRERIIVALTVGCLLLFVLAVALVVTPKYSATMIVAPAQTGLEGSSASGMNALGGVSQFFAATQRVTPFQIYLKIYKSPELASALIRDHDVLKLVFADNWNRQSGRWRPATLLGRAMSLVTKPSIAPTVNDLSSYLSANIAITPGDGEEMQTVSFLNKDRALAGEILRWTHDEAEILSKRRVQERAARNIAYINQKLLVTTQTEQRAALIFLLQAQENTLLSAQSWNAYAGDIISGPWVSDRPVSPNLRLLVALALLGGMVIGCAISFARMLMMLPIYRLPFFGRG